MRKLPYKLQGNTPYERAHNEIVAYLQSLRPLESPGVLTQHTANGVCRKAAPQGLGGSSATVATFLWKSMLDGYSICHTWDGTTEGSDDIMVARDPRVAFSAISGETIDGTGYFYDNWDLTNQTRRVTFDTDQVMMQVIAPRYLVDELIFAIRAPTLLFDEDTGLIPVPWLELLPHRMWCEA